MGSGWVNLTATGNASGKTILAKKERCFRRFMVSLFLFGSTMFRMFHEWSLFMFFIVTGCPLCLSGVRENVPVSLSRCEKVFLIWNTPLLKYLKYSTSEVCDFFGIHILRIPYTHNISGGRAANGWIWFLLWGWKNETNRQAKLLGVCKKTQNLFGSIK